MKSYGKIFEEQFKKSVPSYCMVHRLKDSAQSYNNSNVTKFTWDNPCDFFIFDSNAHLLYALELKSTKYKSMSYESEDEDKKTTKMIKFHQINSLVNMSEYDGIISGFIFNFRDELNNIERTYFQNIKDFINMCEQINKKSFNEIDLIMNNAIKIEGRKKRVYYTWDIDKLLSLKHE